MLRYAACSHNPRLRNLCGGRLLNRLDIGPTTALELDVQDVRFGSKADICSAIRDVRFTPKSGHVQCTRQCPLCANSGHRAVSFDHLIGGLEWRMRGGATGLVSRRVASS